LQMNPEQAQVFTPTPGTYSAVMYYTEMDPKTRKKIFVEKDTKRKEKQKNIVVNKEHFATSGFAS
ncbi:MAG: YgiQ family radical SAM protein, partial [Sulfurimonas sp.]|nr:YgiQ family radical SAM protein [Sulfurimonas sp.]